MIEVRNLLFSPLELHLDKTIRIEPRETVTIDKKHINHPSLEMNIVANACEVTVVEKPLRQSTKQDK